MTDDTTPAETAGTDDAQPADCRDTGAPITDGGVPGPGHELPDPGAASVTGDAEDHLLDHLRLNNEYVTEDGRDAARVALERAEAYDAGTAADDGGTSR
jgi:hypothetical protein